MPYPFVRTSLYWTVSTLLLLCSTIAARGQKPSDIDRENCIRELLELTEDEETRTHLVEVLQSLSEHPIDLNRATHKDLVQLPLFDDFFVRNLLLYRSRTSGFSSIYDLKHVQGAPIALLPLLEPFITVSSRINTYRPRTHTAFIGSELTLYAPSQSYPTTPSFLFRYESTGRVGWHVAVENDRGESFRPLREGFADYSTLSVYGDAKVRQTDLSYVVGDYRVNTGQGLLLGQSNSYFSSLSYGTGLPVLSHRSLSPHRSFRENGYLRGGALDVMLPSGLELMLFAGYEPIDARIEGVRLQTIYANTLHRTTNERRYRHTAQRQAIGGYLAYNHANLHIGLSTVHYRHRSGGITLLPPLRYPQSKTLQQWAIDASYTAQRWQVFIESTLDRSDRLGVQGGLRYFDDHLGSITLQGRYYGTHHTSPYGSADSHSATGRNERGLRLMWHGEIARWTTATILIDHFGKADHRSQPSTIVQGRINYLNSGTSAQGLVRLSYRSNRSHRLTSRATVLTEVSPLLTVRAGAQLTYTHGTPLSYSLYTRAQIGRTGDLKGEVGLQYFSSSGSSFRADTPYMPYHYYNPALRGNGLYVSGALRYPVTSHVSLQARASHTIYIHPKSQTPNPSLLYLTLSIRT